MPIGGNFDSNTSVNSNENQWWNYTNPDKDNYRDTLVGTVVEIHEVLSTYQQEVLWFPQKEDGTQDPKKDWLLVVRTDDFEPTELRFSEGKHKSLWQQLWYSAIMNGEPEPARETAKKYSLPDMLAGAHIRIQTPARDTWPSGTKARPWRAMIDRPGDPQSGVFRGFFEDWRTDTRYTESEQYKRNQEVRGVTRQKAEEAIKTLETNNPKIAEIAKRHMSPAEAAYADSDIPF